MYTAIGALLTLFFIGAGVAIGFIIGRHHGWMVGFREAHNMHQKWNADRIEYERKFSGDECNVE